MNSNVLKKILLSAAALVPAALASGDGNLPKISFNGNAGMPPLYRCGETAEFRIRMPEIPDAEKTFRITLLDDRNRKLLQKDCNPAEHREVSVSGTLQEPGFLRCRILLKKNGKPAFPPLVAAAGFDVEKIRPGADPEAGFLTFWKTAKEKFDREIPADFQMKFMKTAGAFRHYEATCANYDGSRTYSYISIPEKPDRYPILVKIPPAGPGIWRSFNRANTITATINVHHRRMGLADGKQDQKAYKALNTPLLYSLQGAPDREKYYYYKSILGVQRILDYLTARPEWDGRHLVMDGQSQGGAFSLMMAALYPKVTAAAAEIPALCDHRGPQPGWPRLLSNVRNSAEMSGYYDTAFFCREIRVPVIVAVGMIDTLCPPRSVLAAFNSIPGQEKRLLYGPFTGHGWGEKMRDFESLRLEFIRQQLTK